MESEILDLVYMNRRTKLVRVKSGGIAGFALFKGQVQWNELGFRHSEYLLLMVLSCSFMFSPTTYCPNLHRQGHLSSRY